MNPRRQIHRTILREIHSGTRAVLIICLIFLPAALTLNSAVVYGLNSTFLAIYLSPTAIAFGQPFTVSVKLVGATAATAGGTVTYSLYQNGACSGLPVPGQTKPLFTFTVSKGTVSPALNLKPNQAGTFSVNAQYSGDGSNSPSLSACLQLKVTKTPTTLMTSFTTPTTFTVGGSIADSATLSGANAASAMGTITYLVYHIGTVCTGSVVATSGPITILTAGIVPPSGPITINAAGTYSMAATYSGDSVNQPSTSPCESPITVTKETTLTISTTPSSATVSGGTAVSDTATLSGVTSNAGGQVEYVLYFGVCSGTPAATVDYEEVVNRVVSPSRLFVLTKVGNYFFKAIYSGDSNNAGITAACETVTVTDWTPTLMTTLSASTIVAGQSITDSAILKGASPTAGGTVTYQLFTNTACSGSPLDTSMVTVSGGIVPNSKAFIISGTSYTYGIQAIYSGDANNAGLTGPCEQPINVNKANPTVSTHLSASSITMTGSVTDTATLAGSSGSNAAGTVSITMYTGGTCSGTAVGSASVPTVSNNMATSGAFTAPGPGTYSFLAMYSGDANNNAENAACEKLTVTAAVVSLSTVITPPSTPLGTVTDTATLSGFAIGAGGSITFTLYSGSSCSGAFLNSSPPIGVSGGVESSPYVTPVFVAGGPYSILAVYSGDSNNLGAKAPCETVTVQSANTISTTLLPGSITVGQTAKDSATMSGVTPTASGTVTYEVFAVGGTCTGAPIDTSIATVIGGKVPNSKAFNDFHTAGTYPLWAVYSGDNFNIRATSPCESLTVIAQVTITTQLSATTITISAAWENGVTDSATLTGATSNAGGSVTYSYFNGGSCSGTAYPHTDTETVTNGLVPPTSAYAPFYFSSSGTYSFQAVYTDPTKENSPATSPCEILTVNRNSPTISTLLSATTIIHGGSVTDTSTLFGAFSPTGLVTFTMYSGGSCSGTTIATSTVSGYGSGVATSGTFQGSDTATPGTYSFVAFYSGDLNNNVATSSCELLTIT